LTTYLRYKVVWIEIKFKGEYYNRSEGYEVLEQHTFKHQDWGSVLKQTRPTNPSTHHK